MARPAELGDDGPPGRAEAADREGVRRLRRHLRLPAGARRAGPPRRARRPGARPDADAGAGPAALPAAAVAADHDRRRRRRDGPRPAVPRLHRRPAGGEAGWGHHLHPDLVIDALEMASRNYPLAAGAIFHSDRGTQYTSQAFANKTAELGIRRSVGRTGVCFDNAQAESFNAAVKVERVNRTVYSTREHARKDVARYIEFRYNRKRLHSALGYQTPEEAYNGYLNRQTAA